MIAWVCTFQKNCFRYPPLSMLLPRPLIGTVADTHLHKGKDAAGSRRMRSDNAGRSE